VKVRSVEAVFFYGCGVARAKGIRPLMALKMNNLSYAAVVAYSML